MNKIVRYWNQNRWKIIRAIIIIALVIVLIQTVNSILTNVEKRREENQNIDQTKPVQSVLTGEVVSEQQTNENQDIIQEFVKYNNNKEYEKAFSLLTKECKEEFNNDINRYIQNYANKIYNTKKIYDLKLWIHQSNLYTYRIRYYENNLLEMGGANIDKNIEEYITIVKNNDSNKININNFIIKKDINISQRVDDIEILIHDKKIYQDYEVYNLTIKNYSDKYILINDGKDSDDICIVDRNEVKYSSRFYEIPSESLLISPGRGININMKFDKLYDIYREIDNIQFNNIISDYNKYIQNPQDITINRVNIEIDI